MSMVQQFFMQQVPSVRLFDEDKLSCQEIYSIDVVEVTPETTARIAKHAGESGKVYADTRVIMPARYRTVIAFPEISTRVGLNAFEDAYKNLLDASYKKPCKYAITSFFTRGYNFMVVSSRNRDTTDMMNLRLQEVVFEECLIYDKKDDYEKTITDADAKNQEHVSFLIASPQFGD